MARKIVKAVIGQYHDYVAMNAHEIVLDPTPEDCDRIFKESAVTLIAPWESFDAFGEWCDSVWNGEQPMEPRDLAISGLGIGGEIAEVVEKIVIAGGKVQEKVKKDIRDGKSGAEAGILKELGDVVHYACTIARYYGYKPSDILRANYDKLEGRIARGTQRGSGDER